MCGRYTLRTPAEKLAAFFQLSFDGELRPRYNIAPTQNVLAIRVHDGDNLEWCWLRWGLVPSWVKDVQAMETLLINARSEDIEKKPSFRSAFRRRRCLIPADGFFEWQRMGKQRKQPYYLKMADDSPMAFAGVWERWSNDGISLESCAILTTEANAVVRPFHDRMPVILPRDTWRTWLSPESPPAELHKLLRPAPDEVLVAYPVSTAVNYVANDSPSCIEPLREEKNPGMLF